MQKAEKPFGELRLAGVTRRFGNSIALSQLSLTIAAGEFIALLGPSGCGKSTALNCVAGLLPLTEGSISLDERRIDHLPPERRGFGMVFQNYALFPHLNARRNIGFGLVMRGFPKAEIRQRVEAALSLVQLEGHGDKLPSRLSGGQQQRVAIARAIVVEPALVLMDEPLSNLDAKLRLEMRSEIKRIHREVKRTTIYVTHDQDEALSLADRIVVLQDGVVQQVAEPEVLYQNPASLHVARFLGFRNTWEGDLRDETNGRAIVGIAAGILEGALTNQLDSSRVYAAIRPEDVSIVQEQEKKTYLNVPNFLRGEVILVEYCGRDYQVTLRFEGGLMLQMKTSRRVCPGDRLTVRIDRVLFFPPSSNRILQ